MNKYKKFQKEEVEEFPNATRLFEPLVTVCVFTYNHVNFIRKCLDGIINQKTNFKYEVYVGEDDSEDGTREICLEYAKKYPEKIRLFLHKKENKMFIKGRKTGRFNFLFSLYAARGRYIALCEGDDYWTDENKLQEQIDFLESNPEFSMCFTNFSRIDPTGKIIKSPVFNFKDDVFTQETLVPFIVPPTLSIVFRKDTLPAELPDELLQTIGADAFLKSLISLKGPVKYINKITGNKCLHEGGAFQGQQYVQRRRGAIINYSIMLKYFKSKKVRKNLKKAISQNYSKLLFYYFRKKNLKLFIFTLAEALKFHIFNIQGLPVKFYYLKLKNNKN